MISVMRHIGVLHDAQSKVFPQDSIGILYDHTPGWLQNQGFIEEQCIAKEISGGNDSAQRDCAHTAAQTAHEGQK